MSDWLHGLLGARGDALPDALARNLAIPGKLASAALPDDGLPTSNELLHWSARLTHATITAGIAIGIALVLHFVIFALLRRIARRADSKTDSVAIIAFNQSVRVSMVAIAIAIASQTNRLLGVLWGSVDQFVVPALIGWVILSLVRAIAELLQRHAEDIEDILDARSRSTRITLLTRSVSVIIVVVTVAMIMLGIPGVRHIGATLIASAGIIGLAVGAAAQPALKSLIAGVQIAISQPIRIGDFVVVDSESGRVEDIRFSFVVIRTADERRLIVPTTKFLDSTFQNWTRSSGITGPVGLALRPGTAIAPIREAFVALLADMPMWDKRTAKLVVTDSKIDVIEVKLFVSATGPNDLASLRAEILEAMLEWLREHMPTALAVTVPKADV